MKWNCCIKCGCFEVPCFHCQFFPKIIFPLSIRHQLSSDIHAAPDPLCWGKQHLYHLFQQRCLCDITYSSIQCGKCYLYCRNHIKAMKRSMLYEQRKGIKHFLTIFSSTKHITVFICIYIYVKKIVECLSI